MMQNTTARGHTRADVRIGLCITSTLADDSMDVCAEYIESLGGTQ